MNVVPAQMAFAGTADPFAQAKQYLARVVPWPNAGEAPAYVNICNTFQGQGYAKPAWSGRAVTSLNEAINYIQWSLRQPDTLGLYLCLSTQGQPGAANTTRNGFPYYKANRNQPNAVALKSLFLDIDTKLTHDDAEYEDLPQAAAALAEFVKAAGLPRPSIIVCSGGGLQPYWCMSRALTPDEWKPLALALVEATKRHGLKCDTGCTIDSARVMRIPDTENRKIDPPLPVQIVGTPTESDYPVELIEEKLKPYFVALPAMVTTSFLEKPELFPQRAPLNDNELGACVELNLNEIRAAVAAIPPSAIASEEDWTRFARGLAHAALLHPAQAEELWLILDTASRSAASYDAAENRARWDRYVSEAGHRERPITIATIYAMARSAGWGGADSAPVTTRGNPSLAGSPANRMSLKGGVYDKAQGLQLFNSHFFIALVKGACPIAQIQDDGTIAYLAPKDFALLVRNISIRKHDGKLISGHQFWLAHPDRHQRKVVFRPGGQVAPDEYNHWRGFAITAIKGWSRQRRLLSHIFIVICRRDKSKFKYLLRWLAWAVQHPDQRAETVIVLQSGAQGTGKTTLSHLMRDLFGNHGRTINSKARLLSQFNADLETVCWISGEEMLWAGDKGGADALKSIITGDTLTLEVKNGPRWDVPNRLHLLLTTNHVHAVSAGTNERRHFVLDVSDEKARDMTWFDPLYADLKNGGKAQFLWLLQNLRLGDWHPRQLPKTAETADQQRMSADSVVQWANACCEADAIVAPPMGVARDLGTTIETQELLSSYTAYCRQRNLSTVDDRRFGRALTAMFGPNARKRLSAASSRKGRPYTYDVPDGDAWRRAIDKYLGI